MLTTCILHDTIVSMSPENKTFVEVAFNRSGLGDSDHTHVVIVGTAGGVPADVPRKDLIVNKQKINRELLGTLEVNVVEDHGSWDLVEVEIRPGEIHHLRVDKSTHQLVPIRMQPVYYEFGEYIAKTDNIRDHT